LLATIEKFIAELKKWLEHLEKMIQIRIFRVGIVYIWTIRSCAIEIVSLATIA
jgi:hypothetical protein